jgi:glycosyltransferase involved in cell wall biosynthesis
MRAQSAALRVLMVTPRYPPYVGGVEQHVHEVAQRLRRSGTAVTVLTTDREGALPRFEQDGVPVERVRAWPRGRDYYFAPSIYRAIVARRGEWDLVHVQSYHTFVAPISMTAALRSGLPYVLTFHGGGHSSRGRQMLRGPQRRALRPLVRRASRLVAVARFEIDLYSTAYGVPPDRFELIPNGIDVAFAGSPAEPIPGLIISVGRLERYKGHHRILGALPAVLRSTPDARLWILGSGPFEDELRAQAAALGVEDRVEIRSIPVGERDEMAAALGRASLVVLLSEYETHPLAVLEAAAIGRRVLVAATSGLVELAERGLATSIPLESGAEEIAAAVVRELETPRVPPSVRLPTWDECAESLAGLYEQIVEERRTAERRNDDRSL